MKFCDSHAHLTSGAVLPEIDSILQRARAAGIDWIVNICTDSQNLKEGIRLSQRERGIVNAGATTPHDVEKIGDAEFFSFAEAAKNGLLVAIGETGLDYHYEHSNKKVQQQFLIRYLHLAQEASLPVIFHCREAFADLFAIVDSEYQGNALLHCFTGTAREAEQVIERGWYLSISGIVTFKKSEELRSVAREVPIHQLLIETDTPYLAPQTKRGKSNEPAFLVETAACIANVRNIDLSELAKSTRENTIRFFSLPV